MNYEETLEYIHSINWQFCNPGLDRIRYLCQRLGNPQDKLKFIHVAGTNGKGSFCAMISSVLESSGYKTGLFTSPYIKNFNERMMINGTEISNERLIEITDRIRPIADSMEEKPTEFELITAIAFEYFYEEKCDIVVLECGLGGRLDSTNIIKTPLLCVITGIALDHTAILGDTIDKIAYEKAGIIKEGIPCIYCGEDKNARSVIKKRADEVGSDLILVDHSKTITKEMTLKGTVIDYDEHKDIFFRLLGEYQPYNATNVLCAIDVLKNQGFIIDEENIKNGFSKVSWPARFEVLSDNPLMIFDGGHNPQGVDYAVRSIKRYFGDKKIYVISGVMADKDYSYIAGKISEIAAEVFCITPDNKRALDSKKYADVFNNMGIKANGYDSMNDAINAAIKKGTKDKKEIFFVGSLYSYSEVCSLIKG